MPRALSAAAARVWRLKFGCRQFCNDFESAGLTGSVKSARSDAPVVELRPEDLVEDLFFALAEVDVLLLRARRLLLLSTPHALAHPGDDEAVKKGDK